jgi:hypothetical protein
MSKDEMLAYMASDDVTVDKLRKLTDEWVANGASLVWIGQVVYLLGRLDKAEKVVEAAKSYIGDLAPTEIDDADGLALYEALKEYDR